MTLTGDHLIAGEWQQSEAQFESQPAQGAGRRFANGGAKEIERACAAAEAAFAEYAALSREARAGFLEAIAQEIDARGDAITEIGTAETGLPAARLQGERGRTVGQLRLFAEHIRAGDYLDRRHDSALPDRAPLPRPDLRMVQRPIGPVAVFGASNFPLAFSTAGGDTAAALAAGCAVIVKGHPAHPGTGEIVARAIDAARQSLSLHPGVFSFVQGDSHALGAALVQDPRISAVGFTGSLRAGRALFDLCAARPVPIPFFGELGSVNPMFILPQAAASRGPEIGQGWAASLTMGVGQFCTNPGIAIVETGAAGDHFVEAAQSALAEVTPQLMLTQGIAEAYRGGVKAMKSRNAVREILSTDANGQSAGPALFETEASAFLQDRSLGHEVFGPLGLVVRVSGADEMRALASDLEGQLTATLHLDDGDHTDAAKLLPILERKAGRVLANGFPTGVEVSDAMVHGGPYPASTNFGATSVGTLAIRRFLRPVCYQNMPDALLPADLR